MPAASQDVLDFTMLQDLLKLHSNLLAYLFYFTSSDVEEEK